MKQEMTDTESGAAITQPMAGGGHYGAEVDKSESESEADTLRALTQRGSESGTEA